MIWEMIFTGCGWGFLLIEAAKKYKVRGTGITLSVEQHRKFERRIQEEGLEDFLSVELMDYRDGNQSVKSCGDGNAAGFFIPFSDLNPPPQSKIKKYGKIKMFEIKSNCVKNGGKIEFLFTKAALHKLNDWKYEDEWRIICSTPDYVMERKDIYPIKANGRLLWQ